MDIRQLQTLVAIADHGTFARAAEVVHITPSAVSQQIRALESEFGVPLFNRESRPPSLNLQGLQLIEMARKVLRTVEETKIILDGRRATGTLTIGSVRTSTIGLLPLAIVGLRQTYPELKVNLRVGLSNELINDLLADRINMGIVAEHVGMPRTLKWSPFIREPLVVIAPPDAGGETFTEILENTPFIRFSSPVPLANLIDTELAKMGIFTNDIAEIDTIPAIVEFVTGGLGAGVVPSIALRSNNLPLKTLPFGDPPVFRQIGIVQAANSPKARFFDEVHRQLANAAGEWGVYPSDDTSVGTETVA
ncbi:LysR family transcriptional regulator [Tropicimonas sp. IMCC6043]|uniref:LysR family transcriptional regulator n=1 Tax=Tropicimonas sp. IMCC6043 TaxID=2510645 RepID=UPI00101B713F|nr:LysR substrate-binding domain-containing protein [Tropicimonas sp. IMCC6043]RYH06563.1 LysR family transcriptional regulator [Tropicimonas sp. IMCC6043]